MTNKLPRGKLARYSGTSPEKFVSSPSSPPKAGSSALRNRGNRLKKEKEIQKDIRELVLARIRAASGDLRVSIGDVAKGYSKKELIESVEVGDEIGKEVTDIQMEYLKDMAQGKIYSFNGNPHN